ncbi:hypothetical protein [Noviherbaspirillum sp. Root189]|uniref:hypothetical protein n=1 Tax=Noviherbaspirillum sp. Root189 TaxID=1736487 RepID=UPI00070C5D3E|nr:hypothetical protein [Noviherbaspirillum sp. Root189]KRB93789.1 hypothetical protein ASE07_12020 [Noviherbaspirillum sp. Root189]
MANNWLSLLKNVPWSDVISSAPKVAEGARKLWNATEPHASSPPQPSAASHQASMAEAINALDQRVSVAEKTAAELHEQMHASSQLIKALADQNAQLIQRLETQRVRFIWLCCATAVVAAVAVVALVTALR